MTTIRTRRIASVAAAATLLLAAAAPAADAPTKPVATIKASIKPKKVSRSGTPVSLKVSTSFTTDTPGADPFVIEKAVVKFPSGAVQNGRLFPSCSAKTLNKNRGIVSKCPKGSRIGGGTVTANAITLGITAHGKVNLFNGPRGKSVTFNIVVTNPAQINQSFQAPLKKLSGKYGYQLTLKVPANLRHILGSPVAVEDFVVTTKATTVVGGRTRGYIEAKKCPKNHKAPMHLDVFFEGGATAEDDTTIACS